MRATRTDRRDAELVPAGAGASVRAALVAFSGASFLVSLDRAIFAPLLPALARDLNTTVGGAGLAVTAYVLPYGLCQLFYGPLGDRLGRVAVLRWCFVVFALGTGLSALSPNLASLVGLRAATGAAAAAVIPLALAFIGDAVPYDRRQGAIAGLMGVTSLGSALSTAAGGVLGGLVSWRAVFALYGVVSLAVAALLFRLPAARAAVPEAARPRYADVLRLPQARFLYALVALEGAVVLGAFTYLGAFLEERFGLGYLPIGLVLACYGVGTLLASRLFARFGARLPESNRLLLGGLLLAAGYLALLPLRFWPLAALPLLAMGVGFALFHSTLQTRATELVPAARGTAVAVFAFSLFVGGAAGTAAFGWLVTAAGYHPLLLVAGLALLAVTALARRS
ncbi:MAG: MFS transporter [Chloroflexota bacterium]|nr:MFS transporter [Chloroflexota bacterium]